MLKHRDLTLSRIQSFKDTLRDLLYPQRTAVKLSVFSAPDRIPYDQAIQGDFKPTRVGETYGPPWSTHWFKVDGRIPKDWEGREVHLLWDSSSEAQVWQDGRPMQGLTSYEDEWKKPIRIAFRLERKARSGEKHSLYIEMACNRLFGISPGITFPLRQAEIAVFDKDAWNLLWDFVVIADLAKYLPADTPRAGQALYAANQMINTFRPDNPDTWQQARALAAGFYAAHTGEGQHHLSAIGHAHIDTAWLWPMAETRRKCARSFSSALRLMDDYPEYKFACSQAQQYAWMKESYPDLYSRIKERVAEGRFIPVGGTWVEPDCNLPSGESLVRQFLYGQRFFQQEFGQTCGEFWNPDVFGYSAALPQILHGAGINFFLTQKLSWNQFNKPASHTFLWEGLDGSKVLTHFPPADTYNSRADVAEVLFNVSNFKEHDRARESLLLFGYGDGGGGPTPEMLEQLRRMQDVDGLPRVEIRSPREFFCRCDDDIKQPVTWSGELYFELHRGTYTSQAANKRDNRQAEFALHDAEFLAAIAYAQGKSDYPAAELERLWKMTLTNQFHDILPGSSIQEVYQDSARDYAEIISAAHNLRDQALQAIFPLSRKKEIPANILIVNTLSAARHEIVELPFDAPAAQRSASDKPLALLSAPALGYAILPFSSTSLAQQVTASENPAGFLLENAFVRAIFTRGGQLASLYDKRLEREAIPEGRLANQFVLYDDQPVNWEAWDVDAFHLEKFDLPEPAHSGKISERGPLRAAIEFEYGLSANSTLRQTVQLGCHSPRLDFVTQVDWHESQRFLKVEFPLEIRSQNVTYEIQFGHLRRPTHFNTSWDMARFEVCAHRWADLSEPGFGVALLNDSKYGYSCHGNVLRLSLLRAPKSPDAQADMGQHTFRYALLPHCGDPRQAGVIEEGLRFNLPPLLCATDAALTSQSFFRIDLPTTILDSLKKAEDSEALIVRLYEAHGGRGPITFTSSLPIQSVAECDLLETDDQSLEWKDNHSTLFMTPFKIATLKLLLDDHLTPNKI
jgi:alpha-mannosidase